MISGIRTAPVVVTDLDTWHSLAQRGGAATTVAVAASADPVAVAAEAGLTLVDSDGVVGALASHRTENTSLRTMTTMLLAASLRPVVTADPNSALGAAR